MKSISSVGPANAGPLHGAPPLSSVQQLVSIAKSKRGSSAKVGTFIRSVTWDQFIDDVAFLDGCLAAKKALVEDALKS